MVTPAAHSLEDLAAKLAADDEFTRADVDRVLSCPDIVSVGSLGEAARRRRRGDEVTFLRVAHVEPGGEPEGLDDAGEVRLLRAGVERDALLARVRDMRGRVGKRPLTGFGVVELLELAGGDHLALAELAHALHEAGLESVAELPLDELGDTDGLIEIVRAVTHGGLGVWRATVTRAEPSARADLIETAAIVQAETGAIRAFAPLARQDPRDAPATGYDDVRAIAAARVRCAQIRSIQVDWALYGPKLAQVAIAYGADDLDAVSTVDLLQLGHRRSPREDLIRQIAAAFARPVERDGRFEPRP